MDEELQAGPVPELPLSDRVATLIFEIEAALHDGKIPEIDHHRIRELSESERQSFRDHYLQLQELYQVYSCATDQEPIFESHTRLERDDIPGDEGDLDFDSSSVLGQHLSSLGRFEILRGLGMGGHGIVFLASDPLLDRLVALKVPRPDVLANESMRRRFLREGQAAAALAHPNIVRVYEAGQAGPVCFLVQEYVPGPSLAQWLIEHPGEVSQQQAAEFLIVLAEAVEVAHKNQILHRDIKPANILLSPKSASSGDSSLDRLEPKLADFGTARMQTDLEQTRTGGILGTPAFMSPEQAAGRSDDIGPQTDIYSLGAVMAELLRGQPDRERSDASIEIPVTSQQKIDMLRNSNLRISADLLAICAKCLETSPQNRYATARELGEDLQSYLRGDSVAVRLAGRSSRFQPVIRHLVRTPITTLTLFVAAILIGVVLLAWSSHTSIPISTDNSAGAHHNRADQYATDMARVDLQLRSLPPSSWGRSSSIIQESRELLSQYIPQPGEQDLRGFEWYYQWKTLHLSRYSPSWQPIRRIAGHQGDAYFVEFSPDGRWLASAGKDGFGKIWNTENGQLKSKLDGHRAEISCITFSPDGKMVMTCGEDRAVRLWNVESGKEIQTVWQHTSPVVVAVFRPASPEIAAAAADGTILVWNFKQNREALRFHAHEGVRIEAISYSPDGSLLATGTNIDGLRMWNAKIHYKALEHFKPALGLAESVAFSPDGRNIAKAGSRNVWIQDTQSGQKVAAFNVPGHQIRSLKFLKDGRTLVTVGEPLSTGLLDRVTGQFTPVMGNNDAQWGCAVDPSGKRVATSDIHGQLQIWNCEQQQAFYHVAIESLPHSFLHTSLSSDGQQLAVAHADGRLALHSLSVWPPKKVREIGVFQGQGFPSCLATSPNGQKVVAGLLLQERELALRMIDLKSDQNARDFNTLSPNERFRIAQKVFFSPDGLRITSLHGAGGESGIEIRVWNVATGKPELQLHSQKIFSSPFPMTLSPAGEIITTVLQEEGRIELIDLNHPQDRVTYPQLDRPVRSIVVSGDGQRVIADLGNGNLEILDKSSGKRIRQIKVQDVDSVGGNSAMCLDPANRTALLGTSDGIVLADLESGVVKYKLPFPEPAVLVDDVQMSADGQVILAITTDSTGKCSIQAWSCHLTENAASAPDIPAHIDD